MEVEHLANDELFIELEVRGMIDSSTPQVLTDSQRRALLERLKSKLRQSNKEPQDRHEAAVNQPLQEVAMCQTKLRALKEYILENIWAGISVDEMLPQVQSKMMHIQGRMFRASGCDVFREKSASMWVVRDFLYDMVDLLLEDRVSPFDVADKLARVVIRVDTPIIEHENRELREVEVEEVNWQIAEFEEGVEEMRVVELEEKEATSDEQKESEDQMADTTLDDSVEDLAPIDYRANSIHTGTWQTFNGSSVPQINDSSPDLSNDTCLFAKEDRAVTLKPPLQTIGGSYGKALKTRRQQGNGTRYQVRGLSCARLTVQFRLRYEWLAARWRMPVDRLWWVLDLRLQDEVLAKANRRIRYEVV